MVGLLCFTLKEGRAKSAIVAKDFPGITLCFFPKGRNRVETDEVEASVSILTVVISY
jgi:hypothetical protein